MLAFDMEECPHCRGSGLDRDGTFCRTCGGIGQVPKRGADTDRAEADRR